MRKTLAGVAVTVVMAAMPTAAIAKAPPGATAICRDHTYSFSHHRRGTCSHHHGVLKWLKVVAP